MSWWVKIIGFLIAPIPRQVLRALGKPLGFIWFDVLRLRRKIVLENLTKAFPDWSEEQKLRAGRRSVYILMENFFEFFLIPAITPQWTEKNIVFEGEENLKEALAQKKGVLILTLHLGHGDLMGSVLANRGYKVSIITKFFKSQWLNRLWFGVRQAQGMQCIPPHGEKTPFQILKALKGGHIVGFVLDQHMGRPYGIKTTFFGHPAGTAFGLALFHMKTEAPIVPLYNFQGPDGKIHIVTERAFNYDKAIESEDRDAALARLTQLYTNKIEEIVRKHPEQWMWVHRRWKWKDPK